VRRRACDHPQLSNHQVAEAFERRCRNNDDRDRSTPRKSSHQFGIRDQRRCLRESINHGSFLSVLRISNTTDAWIYSRDRTGATDSKNSDVMQRIKEPGHPSSITQGPLIAHKRTHLRLQSNR
jgi:hypothetical protein